jgi:hypothetical protein
VLSVLEFAIADRYIGCLENKEDVCRFSSKPMFHIVSKVGKYDISKADMLLLSKRDVTFDKGEQLQLAKLQVDIMQRNHLLSCC